MNHTADPAKFSHGIYSYNCLRTIGEMNRDYRSLPHTHLIQMICHVIYFFKELTIRYPLIVIPDRDFIGKTL